MDLKWYSAAAVLAGGFIGAYYAYMADLILLAAVGALVGLGALLWMVRE